MNSKREIDRHSFRYVSCKNRFTYYFIFLVTLWIVSSDTIVFAGEQVTDSPATDTVNIVAVTEAVDTDTQMDDSLADTEDDLYGDEYIRTADKSVPDPLYWFNYAMFSFNDKLYFWLLKPVAQGYKFITPAPLRAGFRNFFHNALFPLRFVNNVLQGKGERAVDEVKSFVINTVGGGLGFATPAQYVFGIKTYKEDLGQTFGRYSVKEGFYLVLPLIGSSTLRDAVGSVGDFFLSPVTYIEPTELAVGVGALDKINDVSFRIGDYEALKNAALDPYVSIKDAYIQMRRKQIKE